MQWVEVAVAHSQAKKKALRFGRAFISSTYEVAGAGFEPATFGL